VCDALDIVSRNLFNLSEIENWNDSRIQVSILELDLYQDSQESKLGLLFLTLKIRRLQKIPFNISVHLFLLRLLLFTVDFEYFL